MNDSAKATLEEVWAAMARGAGGAMFPSSSPERSGWYIRDYDYLVSSMRDERYSPDFDKDFRSHAKSFGVEWDGVVPTDGHERSAGMSDAAKKVRRVVEYEIVDALWADESTGERLDEPKFAARGRRGAFDWEDVVTVEVFDKYPNGTQIVFRHNEHAGNIVAAPYPTVLADWLAYREARDGAGRFFRKAMDADWDVYKSPPSPPDHSGGANNMIEPPRFFEHLDLDDTLAVHEIIDRGGMSAKVFGVLRSGALFFVEGRFIDLEKAWEARLRFNRGKGSEAAPPGEVLMEGWVAERQHGSDRTVLSHRPKMVDSTPVSIIRRDPAAPKRVKIADAWATREAGPGALYGEIACGNQDGIYPRRVEVWEVLEEKARA